jgi:phosphate transport system substrate-binding protein
MKLLRTLFPLFIITVMSACNGAAGRRLSASQHYSLGGSTTVAPIIENAIEVLEVEYPQYHITYEAQGTSAGIQGLFTKTFLLAGASRDLSPDEVQKGAVAHAFALDGLAVIVNEDVFVTSVTRDDLRRIYDGSLTNWSELGGKDLPIEIVNREEGSGTRESFTALVMKNHAYKKNVITIDSNGNMVTMVTEIPGAIGYCGFSFIEKTYNMGGRVLKVEDIEPTAQNVRDKHYPLSRELYLVSEGPVTPGSFGDFFLNWLLSPEGQKIVENQGFVTLSTAEPATRPLAD